MSAIRRLAVRISEAVVQRVAPGCKVWAEGLAREVEFIESDWRALGWAIGSVRVVLDRRNGTRREAPPARWIWPIAKALWTFDYALDALRAANWHDRIASSLISLGWISWMIYSVVDWFWTRNEPPISDIQAYRLFSRATLELRLERYRSVRRWFPLLIPVSMGTGFVMTFGVGDAWGRIFAGFTVVVSVIAIWMLCLDTPAKIEERPERVNERIAESASGGGR